jgi:hypothetical protein
LVCRCVWQEPDVVRSSSPKTVASAKKQPSMQSDGDVLSPAGSPTGRRDTAAAAADSDADSPSLPRARLMSMSTGSIEKVRQTRNTKKKKKEKKKREIRGWRGEGKGGEEKEVRQSVFFSTPIFSCHFFCELLIFIY